MSDSLQPLGRALIVIGAICVVGGLALLLGVKLPWLGRLPGDIAVRRDHVSFYVPLTTCLLVSALLSLIMWIVGRFRH